MEQSTPNERSYAQWYHNLDKTLVELEEHYLFHDTDNVTMGAFAGFVHDSLANPDFEYYVQVLREAHPAISPKVAFNLLLRSFQDDGLHHDQSYPIGYEHKEKWHDSFASISEDVIREGTLELNLRQHLLSNVSERYKTIPLLINLMEDRFKEEPSILDVGCSQMHGGKKLAYQAELGPKYGNFKNIELLDTSSETSTIDKRLSKVTNFIMKQHVDYGAMTGIDIRNIDDPAIKRFAKSCSFYPDELRNEDKVTQFEALDNLDPRHERVKFHVADISSDIDARNFRNQSEAKRYDIIIFSTVLYQVSPAEQIAMKVNAMNMLTDNGIIIVQDAPDGDFSKKYNYVTSVIDARQIEKGEQPLLRWATGRCLRAVPEAGRIAFKASKTQTITDRLAEINSSIL